MVIIAMDSYSPVMDIVVFAGVIIAFIVVVLAGVALLSKIWKK